jgi:integrase
MACVYHEKKRDTWKVLFYVDGKKRKALCLGKTTRKMAEWWQRLVEELQAAQAAGGVVSKELATKVGKTSTEMQNRLAGVGLIEKPTPDEDLELGKFLDRYITRHEAKGSTKTVYGRTKNHLVAHFKANRLITTITLTDADDWLDYLKTKLSKATVARTVGIARQFFRWALKRKLVEFNPFSELPTEGQKNKARQHFIDRESTQKLLDAAPDGDWRAIIALSRYGGLRCPSEHLGLRWKDIDWNGGKMLVHSPKTEHHAGQESRFVPLFAELKPYLKDLFDPQAEYVINRYRRPDSNMRTTFEKIIKRAGLKPWPKLFANLRASRGTELARVLPAHVAAAILGHSVEVAKDHYWQVNDQDIQSALSVSTDTGDQSNDGRNGGLAGSTLGNTEVQESEKATPSDSLNTDNSVLCELAVKVEMGVTGLEPVTSTV